MAQPSDWPDEGDEGATPVFAPDLHDARHLWLKSGLLAVWVLASFGVCYFARHLMFTVGGWPVGLWMASQGAVFVFFGVVVVYAVAMSWFERQDLQRGIKLGADCPSVHPDVPARAVFRKKRPHG